VKTVILTIAIMVASAGVTQAYPCGDVNQDGVVTASDVRAVLLEALGLESGLQCSGQTLPAPEERACSDVSDDIDTLVDELLTCWDGSCAEGLCL